ncbi:histidine kinase [Nonomuraea angiospora]|uniref:sensor histidine kinase n=1 Tax=Nonomuraea angiospora TaxID=46172 RepID=UPI0033E11945
MRRFLDVPAAAIVVGMFWLPPTLASADRSRLVAGLVLACVTGAVMVLRRRLPAGSPLLAAGATIAGSVLGVCQDPMLAAAWCLYPLAVARADRTRTIVLVLAGLLAALATVAAVPGEAASGAGQRLTLAVAALSVSWLLGTAVGRQIAAAREAERARVQLVVARDVHDVVGHALGVISAEAGVTRSLADASEQELRDTLAGVESHARRALEEMQALVRGLRSEPGAPEDVAGIGRLDGLVAATRAAGVGVEARIEVNGPVDDVAGAVAYRIVQESLSNVVRYAAGAACSVHLRQDGGEIVVRVRDHGPGARPARSRAWPTGSGDGPGPQGMRERGGDGSARGGDGSGPQGMRERARLMGGTVTWGDHPEGGFEARARLPVRSAP